MDKVRPKLPSSLTDGELKEEELFQNMVLRPVIKMQHDVLILRVRSYFTSKKVIFHLMDTRKRTMAIEQAFLGDNAFKKEIQGLIYAWMPWRQTRSKEDFSLGLNLLVATLPIVIVGLFASCFTSFVPMSNPSNSCQRRP